MNIVIASHAFSLPNGFWGDPLGDVLSAFFSSIVDSESCVLMDNLVEGVGASLAYEGDV